MTGWACADGSAPGLLIGGRAGLGFVAGAVLLAGAGFFAAAREAVVVFLAAGFAVAFLAPVLAVAVRAADVAALEVLVPLVVVLAEDLAAGLALDVRLAVAREAEVFFDAGFEVASGAGREVVLARAAAVTSCWTCFASRSRRLVSLSTSDRFALFLS